VRNRATKGCLCGGRLVDMNELMVFGAVSESIDTLLIDLKPFSGAAVLSPPALPFPLASPSSMPLLISPQCYRYSTITEGRGDLAGFR
jgi:hypothetical protein